MIMVRLSARRLFRLVVVACVACPAGLLTALPSSAATGNSYLIESASRQPVSTRGETFFTTGMSVTFAEGDTAKIAGDPDGTGSVTVGDYSGNVYVDDAMDITVTHPDGTMQSATNEWTFECFGLYPSGPWDITGLFQPGVNQQGHGKVAHAV